MALKAAAIEVRALIALVLTLAVLSVPARGLQTAGSLDLYLEGSLHPLTIYRLDGEEFLALDQTIEGAKMVLESTNPAGIALARSLARRMKPIQNIVSGRDVLSNDTGLSGAREPGRRRGSTPTRSISENL